MSVSHFLGRPINGEGSPQHLLAIQAIDVWGLVFVIFDEAAHLYALNSTDRSIQLHSLQEPRDHSLGLGVLERITADIATRHREALIRKERFLNMKTYQAIAVCDFLQEVDIQMPDI